MSTELWDCLTTVESSAIIRNLSFVIAAVIALANRWFVGPSETDDVAVSAAFLVPAGWWPEAPSSETTWDIVGMLFAALIAAGAAWWAARSTMINARDLQDRERRLEEQTVSALLSADLHRKLILLGQLLSAREEVKVKELAMMDTSTKILDAALPKLGALGQQGAANLRSAFYGLELLVRDAREERWQNLTERMRGVALHIGRVLDALWKQYELDRPEPLEKAGTNLETVGLMELKNRGL